MDRPNGGVQQMQPGSGKYSYAMNSWMQSSGYAMFIPNLTICS